MTNILKQFEVSDIDSGITKTTDKTRWHLTLVYSLAIIFVIVVLNISTYFIYTQRLSRNVFHEISAIEEDHHERLSNDEISGRVSEELVEVMIVIDILLLVIVLGLSYFLSRQALKPINRAYLEQKKFLADVAHELRTPLTVMKSGLESRLISKKEDVEATLHQSIAEIDHMSNILNDLIFLIKNDTQKIPEKETVDLSEIVKTEARAAGAYAKAKSVETREALEEGCKTLGNPTQLKQLVKNLIKNAIDYNKKGGEVFVGLSKEGGVLKLSIRDTGVGISKEHQEKIFDRFFKVGGGQKDEAGSGLGLAVVKSIVQKHGGEISVESLPGHGTTINIELKSA